MSRNHARITPAVWNDEEFIALSDGSQRLYFLLLSQPDLSHAGVLSLTVRRWALLAGNTTVDMIRRGLAELHEARFVVVDERTEEVLIRTLIRNDDAWKQPKILAIAIRDAAAVRSEMIRRAVAGELARLDPGTLPPSTRSDVTVLLGDLPSRLMFLPASAAGVRLVAVTDTAGVTDEKDQDCLLSSAFQGDADPPAEGGGEGGGDPPQEGGGEGDGEGVRARARASPTPTPTPNKHTSPRAAPRRRRGAGSEDPDFVIFYERVFPRPVDRDDAWRMWRRVISSRHEDPAKIIAAAGRYADSCRARGTPKDKIKYPATWLSKGSYGNDEQQATPARENPEDVWDA